MTSDLKTIVSSCLLRVNAFMTANSGTQVFSPDVFILEHKPTRIQKFLHAALVNIKSLVSPTPEIYKMNNSLFDGSFAHPSQQKVILSSHQILSKNSHFHNVLSKNTSSEIVVKFTAYHELAHLLDTSKWSLAQAPASKDPISSQIESLIAHYHDIEQSRRNRVTALLNHRQTSLWSKQDNSELDRQLLNNSNAQLFTLQENLAHRLFSQTKEALADCFAILMLAKEHGMPTALKSLESLAHLRRQGQVNRNNEGDDKTKLSLLHYSHYSSQCLEQLKTYLQSLPQDINTLSFEDSLSFINKAVRISVAQEMFNLCILDSTHLEQFEKDLNTIKTSAQSIQSDLFSASDSTSQPPDLLESLVSYCTKESNPEFEKQVSLLKAASVLMDAKAFEVQKYTHLYELDVIDIRHNIEINDNLTASQKSFFISNAAKWMQKTRNMLYETHNIQAINNRLKLMISHDICYNYWLVEENAKKQQGKKPLPVKEATNQELISQNTVQEELSLKDKIIKFKDNAVKKVLLKPTVVNKS